MHQTYLIAIKKGQEKNCLVLTIDEDNTNLD
jgi:hypothetical protein